MTRRKRLFIGIPATLVVILGTAGLLGTGDVIDLPEWLNIKGVDVPLVGDTDNIDCKLESVAGVDRIEIKIVDGDKSTYTSYVNVWRNGNLVDPDDVERLADNLLSAPGEKGVEQFYAISILPDRDARVFCESIVPE